MNKQLKWILFILLVLPTYSCSIVRLDPVTIEGRFVEEVKDSPKIVTFYQSMAWCDRFIEKQHGILFPQGEYMLEAVDGKYFYFRAPNKIEYRQFENGKTINTSYEDGGLFLSKKIFSVVPAGGYTSVSETYKRLTWKLGGDFMSMEGRKYWEKNY